MNRPFHVRLCFLPLWAALLLLAALPSAVAGPLVVHDWTVSTPLGRFGYLETTHTLAADTERCFLVGSRMIEVPFHASTVAGVFVGVFAFLFTSLFLTAYRRTHPPRV